MSACSHLDQIQVRELPEPIDGCAECLASGSSPNRHASRHASASGHAVARSAEPGEDWSWCYVDEVAFVVQAR